MIFDVLKSIIETSSLNDLVNIETKAYSQSSDYDYEEIHKVVKARRELMISTLSARTSSFQRINTKGDGNCFFHALQQCSERLMKNYTIGQLRKKLADEFMIWRESTTIHKNSGDVVSESTCKAIEEEIRVMGSYTDIIAAEVASNVFDIDIILLDSSLNVLKTSTYDMNNSCTFKRDLILIKYSNYHFETVQLVAGTNFCREIPEGSTKLIRRVKELCGIEVLPTRIYSEAALDFFRRFGLQPGEKVHIDVCTKHPEKSYNSCTCRVSASPVLKMQNRKSELFGY